MKLDVLTVAGIDALRALDVHRARFASTGLYPFLIGDHDDLARLEEQAELNSSPPQDIIQASFGDVMDRWLAGRKLEEEEFEDSPEETLGTWPGNVQDKGSISHHKDISTGEFKPEVYIGLARIELPWHLPAALNFGDWNDCPDPMVHCAFHRHWSDTYGAEIVGISSDTIECRVTRPPKNRQSATELAWQQYWYCGDIVHQGCGSVLALAATLLDSPYWFFWWD